MSKTNMDIRNEKIELYEKLVETNPRVKLKGSDIPFTSLNGHMFSFLTREGKLALRLPAEERDVFIKKYKSRLCDEYGTIMEEYVDVPDDLMKKTQELKKYFDFSYTYVKSLEPKPIKKIAKTMATLKKY